MPDNEIEVSFSRASGPGGQNVNKTATKVTVRWPLATSAVATAEQKNLLRQKLATYLTSSGEIVVTDQTTRSQSANRLAATRRLRALVAQGLKKAPVRKPTKATSGSKLRRLDAKRRNSTLKKLRRYFE